MRLSQTPPCSINEPDEYKNSRRDFLKKTTTIGGAVAFGSLIFSPKEDAIAGITSKISRASLPSGLKITDLRYVLVEHLGRRIPILRIDTNQGISGLGEVRDGGDERYALELKSRILGQNPCNVEPLFATLKQFGGHGRLGGGVSGVEMALWDLTGKAWGVPCWQLLGGRYRDKVRLYADTHGDRDFEVIRAKVKHRVEEEGFTWLKMTRCYNVTQGVSFERRTEVLATYFEALRNLVGYDIPISADHFPDRDINNILRLCEALEPYKLAWMEEVIPWDLTEQLKIITDQVKTPIAVGENIYLKESFMNLCDAHAVDIVHPDLATAGGMLETKKIGDYAGDKGIGMALHFAGTPVSFMANVHCAAATRNFLALEFHPEGEEIEKWTNMVQPTGTLPMISKGFANVPLDAPGLGIELNEAEIKKNLHPSDKSFFGPTESWNDLRSTDGTGRIRP
jgi:L-alanine-DL-glutamate epimerase-like enolase superfamily enzyme